MANRKHTSKVARAVADAVGDAVAAAAGKDEDDPELDVGPLFDFQGADAEEHEGTRIFRLEPVDEGHLDDLPPDADRKDIKRRWGGGVFKVQAFSAKKKIMATDSNVKISGDPIFENEVGRKRYEKWLAQQFPTERQAAAAGMDPEDVREQRLQRELAKLRAESEIKEQADERRRQRERDERRAEAEEREAREDARRVREREERAEERRMEREARADERRERMEFESTQRAEERALRQAELEAKGDPMQQFATMAQIFAGLQGDGGDPVSALINRAPEILEQVRETGSAIMASGKKPEQRRQQIRANAKGDHVALEGTTATKAIAAIKRLQKLGKDPEEIMGQFFDAAARAGEPERQRKPAKPLPARSRSSGGKSARPAQRPPTHAARGHANGKSTNAAAGSINKPKPPTGRPGPKAVA